MQITEFDALAVRWDDRVLQPRPWTAEQSRWIADLARGAPDGPILELCCGAGQIGLLAARLTGRPLVQIDRDPVAAGYARENAVAAGVESDVRIAALADALLPGETFALVIADPPWLPTERVGDYPEDPVAAVDGGPDGLAVARECLSVGIHHLAPRGHLVLQVGDTAQAAVVADGLRGAWPELPDTGRVHGLRACRPGGVLVHVTTGIDASLVDA